MEKYDFVTLILDGKSLADQQVLIAVGVTVDGQKVILGFEQTAMARLKRWQNTLNQIRSKADSVAAQQQLEFYRQVDLLEAKLELAQLKLTQLRQATGTARDELKASLDGIFNEIENAIDSATAKIG